MIEVLDQPVRLEVGPQATVDGAIPTSHTMPMRRPASRSASQRHLDVGGRFDDRRRVLAAVRLDHGVQQLGLGLDLEELEQLGRSLRCVVLAVVDPVLVTGSGQYVERFPQPHIGDLELEPAQHGDNPLGATALRVFGIAAPETACANSRR